MQVSQCTVLHVCKNTMISSLLNLGIGRDLVAVVDDLKKEGSKVGDDALSKREVEDLNRGRAFVRSYLEEGGSYLGISVLEATHTTIEVGY